MTNFFETQRKSFNEARNNNIIKLIPALLAWDEELTREILISAACLPSTYKGQVFEILKENGFSVYGEQREEIPIKSFQELTNRFETLLTDLETLYKAIAADNTNTCTEDPRSAMNCLFETGSKDFESYLLYANVQEPTQEEIVEVVEEETPKPTILLTDQERSFLNQILKEPVGVSTLQENFPKLDEIVTKLCEMNFAKFEDFGGSFGSSFEDHYVATPEGVQYMEAND